jgi:hypothetical protein
MVFISYTTLGRGGSSSTSSAHLGRSYMPTLLLLLSKLSLELGSTRAGLWLRPKGKYASRVALCTVETESRKIITTSADGGCQCCQFSSCVAASSLQLQ